MSENYSISPLCWVEGKPVYKGDVLYQTSPYMPTPRIAVNGDENGITDDAGRWNGRSHLTWTPPKTKREGWMNCYKDGKNYVYPTKERADYNAMESRIACIRIEWEE